MNNEFNLKNSLLNKFLKEVKEKLQNPIHKRIIEAYKEDDPLHSMEEELGKIIMEILQREN
jgi:hypothetical protein